MAQSTATSAHPTGKPTECPFCHASVPDGEQFCPDCGSHVGNASASVPVTSSTTTSQSAASSAPVQVPCPACGKPQAANRRFCNGCGIQLRLKPGDQLGKNYVVEEKIGEGGMGEVYRVRDPKLDRLAVVKTLLASNDPGLIAQGLQEGKTLANLEHPNIAVAYECFEAGNRVYIVMEYVEGKTLAQIMEEHGGALEPTVAIRHIRGILPAFAYLAGLQPPRVYCDAKTDNVMVKRLKDGTEGYKLIDVGTVMEYDPNYEGQAFGTPGLAARQAYKKPSPQTDLYSLCRMLLQMVTGMDIQEMQQPQLLFSLPSPEAYQVFIDHPTLYRFLAKGTHARPEQRFQSADEMEEQLKGLLLQVEGGKPGVTPSSRLFVPNSLTTTGRLGPLAEVALSRKDSAISKLLYGDQALRAGKYGKACDFYREALELNHDSVDALLRLAEVFIEQEQLAEALVEVTSAQRLDPNNWKVAFYTGRLLEAQGNYPTAARKYQELMDDIPGELPPLRAMARVRARMGDHAQAVSLFEIILRADPDNLEALLGLTHSLLSLDPLTAQNVQKAAQAIHELEGRTEDARYYRARGDVYRAAWQGVRDKQLLLSTQIAGVEDNNLDTLGVVAAASYEEYLQRAPEALDREPIVSLVLVLN